MLDLKGNAQASSHCLELEVESVLNHVREDGIFDRLLPHFEVRSEQIDMMRAVLDAYNNRRIALIEAGTGTGKSLAYLIPALIWASTFRECTVVSTHTIALQEQLFSKDIPQILDILRLPLKVVLVKGMSNYLCLKKLDEHAPFFSIFRDREQEELEKIQVWSSQTKEGSKSSLPFGVTSSTWEKVSAEHTTCIGSSCPHYKNCFYMKARKDAEDAQVVIVNHYLLCADLSLRAGLKKYEEIAILPPYRRIIVDEAHHLEDVATEYFASRVSRVDMLLSLARLSSDKLKAGVVGKLGVIQEKIEQLLSKKSPELVSQLVYALNIDMTGLRQDIFIGISEFFSALERFVYSNGEAVSSKQAKDTCKFRLVGHHPRMKYWMDEVVPEIRPLGENLRRYIAMIEGFDKRLEDVDHPKFKEQTKSLRQEVISILNLLTEQTQLLEDFVQSATPDGKVRWIEWERQNAMPNGILVEANLDVSNILVSQLFTQFSSIILCSATLTTHGKFNFFRSRLGLNRLEDSEDRIREHICPSPFNFEEQAIFAVPTDIGDPTSIGFLDEVAEKIIETMIACRGNAFILFTSYQMLNDCYEKVKSVLEENHFILMRQGEFSRKVLLDRFRVSDRSILFGTSSFWEGVDVAGDALRCVILVKLPFLVPSEPLLEARAESIATRGGSPFMEYSVPHAIVKFKQGFGRLIRKKTDRGCVICFDNRIFTKSYGSLFLRSLPPCERIIAPFSLIKRHMVEFYKRNR